MGGAFVGLADDATAALANPAGLLEISRPEISFEFRWRQLNQFVEGEGTWASATTNGFSYLSFVYPRQRWAVAAYRHEAGRWSDERTDQVEHAVEDVTIDTYAVAAAFLVGRGVRIGAGLTATSGKYDGLLEFFPPYNYRETQTLSGTKFGANVGVLLRLLERAGAGVSRVQLGAMYRWQSRYEPTTFRDLDGNPPFNPLASQDVFTIGAAVGLGSRTTASFEFMTLRETEKWEYTPPSNTAYEYVPRVGVEYISAARWSPAVRAGYWHEGTFNESRMYRMRVREFIVYPNHFTFGGGFNPHRRIDVNVGFDIAPSGQWPFTGDREDDKRFVAFALSTVFRFVQ